MQGQGTCARLAVSPRAKRGQEGTLGATLLPRKLGIDLFHKEHRDRNTNRSIP